MRCGSLVYDSTQGLGYLAKSFYDAKVITDVMVVKNRYPQQGWFGDSKVIHHFANDRQSIHDFLKSMDVVLFLETDWGFLEFCRREKIKSSLMVMHECFHQRLFESNYRPDLYLCPSLLDLQQMLRMSDGQFTGFFRQKGICYPTENRSEAMFLPVPVEGIKWRQRTEAKVFVHNAGHGGLKGRNGTQQVLDAFAHLKTPVHLIIRGQDDVPKLLKNLTKRAGGATCEVRGGTVPWESLYEEGDVFVFPEAFNGVSLPIQESHAAGMLVMCGERFPMTSWLPNEPMIPVNNYTRERIGPPYLEYDRANFDPRQIAATIDSWYGKDISDYSRIGRAWAEANSWKYLKPLYMEALGNL